MLTEQDVLDFIEANANPTITLDRIKDNYRMMFSLTRMHLGSLLRKKLIFRHEGPHIVYWTKTTAHIVERDGLATFAVEPPVLAPLPKIAPPILKVPQTVEYVASPIKKPAPVHHQTPAPVLNVPLPAIQNSVPDNPDAPMGRMRMSSLSGRIALLFYHHRHTNLTRKEAHDEINKISVVDATMFNQYLGNLVHQGILIKRQRYPAENNIFKWSGSIRYPYSEYLNEDLPPGVKPKDPGIVEVIKSKTPLDEKAFVISGEAIDRNFLKASSVQKGSIVIQADNGEPFDAKLSEDGLLHMKFGIIDITLSKERTEQVARLIGK